MNLWLLVSLLLLIPLVNAGRCPEASIIEPCMCLQIGTASTIQCESFESFDELQKVFDNSYDYPFDTLVMRHSNLPYLNSTWFKTKQIKMLSLVNMTMVDLFNIERGVSAPTLTSMWIEKSLILRGVRWQQFKPFDHLKFLTVRDSDVKKLGDEFKGNVSSTLESIELTNARVTSLEDGQFQGMTKLSSIRFPRNKFKVIKRASFNGLENVLEWLDFSYNPLEAIPEDMFNGMTTLRVVDFRGGKIKTLSKVGSNFKGILSLEENPLVCDCKMSWIPSRDYFQLDGTCESPPSLKSTLLRHLKEEDFEPCNNYLPFDH